MLVQVSRVKHRQSCSWCEIWPIRPGFCHTLQLHGHIVSVLGLVLFNVKIDYKSGYNCKLNAAQLQQSNVNVLQICTVVPEVNMEVV